MEKENAKKIALDFANAKYHVPNDNLILLDHLTIEKEYGWIFFSDSKIYFETKDKNFRVWGNGPILIERESGEIIQFGTKLSPEKYIQKYERKKSSLVNRLILYLKRMLRAST